MRKALIAALLLAPFLAGPVLANEGAPKPAANPTVLMSPVALPVVVDGRLVNYVFVTLRLRLSAKADSIKMRQKEPYFRDALVRAAHRTPFVRPDNYAALDERRMQAVLMREAAAIVGPGMVVDSQIIRAQAQHYDGLPKPKTGPAAR